MKKAIFETALFIVIFGFVGMVFIMAHPRLKTHHNFKVMKESQVMVSDEDGKMSDYKISAAQEIKEQFNLSPLLRSDIGFINNECDVHSTDYMAEVVRKITYCISIRNEIIINQQKALQWSEPCHKSKI